MKLCPSCNTLKPVEQFRKDSSRKDGLVHQCSDCLKGYYRDRYHTKHKDQHAKTSKLRREKNKQVINDFKESGCLLCPEKDISCLDLHHLEEDKKDFTIGQGTSKPVQQILEELKKCVVLCANCHRKVHAGVLELRSGGVSVAASKAEGA